MSEAILEKMLILIIIKIQWFALCMYLLCFSFPKHHENVNDAFLTPWCAVVLQLQSLTDIEGKQQGTKSTQNLFPESRYFYLLLLPGKNREATEKSGTKEGIFLGGSLTDSATLLGNKCSSASQFMPLQKFLLS